MENILSNGKKIPSLGFGVFRMEKTKNSKETLLKAFEMGYRHIDTATAYDNEEIVGQAIRESGLKREELFITTKLSTQDMTDERTKEAFNTSLEKLGLDYVDLYLTHWPVKEKFVKGYLEMEKFYEQGLIKTLGVSNCHKRHLDDLEASCNIMPVVNQIEVNPYLYNEEIIKYCESRNILVEAYSPFCSGKKDILSEEILIEIGKKYNKSSAQVTLRWLIERNIVPLVKTNSPIRAKENFDIFDFSLTKDDMDKIKSINIDTRSMSDPENY